MSKSQRRRGKHTYTKEHARSRTAVTSQNEARAGHGVMTKFMMHWRVGDYRKLGRNELGKLKYNNK